MLSYQTSFCWQFLSVVFVSEQKRRPWMRALSKEIKRSRISSCIHNSLSRNENPIPSVVPVLKELLFRYTMTEFVVYLFRSTVDPKSERFESKMWCAVFSPRQHYGMTMEAKGMVPGKWTQIVRILRTSSKFPLLRPTVSVGLDICEWNPSRRPFVLDKKNIIHNYSKDTVAISTRAVVWNAILLSLAKHTEQR